MDSVQDNRSKPYFLVVFEVFLGNYSFPLNLHKTWPFWSSMNALAVPLLGRKIVASVEGNDEKSTLAYLKTQLLEKRYSPI